MTDTYWHDDPAAHPPVGTWMWHLHHEVICEPLIEPLANRLDYIRREKPAAEVPTRLRLIDPVRGTLPAPLVKAWDAYDKAWAAYVKAWAAYVKAGAAYVKAGAAYVKAGDAAYPEFEALHAIEHPNCPWNGRTIFPGGDR